MTVTVSRLFENYGAAERAVRDLESDGINRDDISIIASNAEGWYTAQSALNDAEETRRVASDQVGGAAAGAGVGAALGGGAGLFAGLGLLAIPGVGPIVAAGWLVATVAGAAAGGATGGLIGALTQTGVSVDEAHVYIEGVRRGGTLVTARVPEIAQGRVASTLDKSAINIAERGAAYRKSGWAGFDETASPYTPELVRHERDAYRHIIRVENVPEPNRQS